MICPHQIKHLVEDYQITSEQIEEGGEYSIDAVATRIMDMAKVLSEAINQNFLR
jgi:hypothetical protein